MENTTHEPQTADVEVATLPTPTLTSPFTRHDGWTGEKMAIFCETLAETAVVAEACDAARMGISGAYACRRRDPVFAAAWDAALTIARERLADTLLARSMEGNIEQVWKDGEVVGERHTLDNHLGLAILRRLDRLAEGGVCVSARDLPFSGQSRSPAVRAGSFNWEQAIGALRTGDDEGVAKALALVEGNKVEEVEALRGGHGGGMVDHSAPLNRPPAPAAEPEEPDLSHRCWLTHEEGDAVWMTSFPPPAGFSGSASCDYGDPDTDYERECTPEEVAVLEADAKRARDAERAEDEDLRDRWFQMLREDVAAASDEPLDEHGAAG